MSRNCVLENLPEATLGSSSKEICINDGILNAANLSCKKSLNSCSDNSIEDFRHIATHNKDYKPYLLYWLIDLAEDVVIGANYHSDSLMKELEN